MPHQALNTSTVEISQSSRQSVPVFDHPQGKKWYPYLIRVSHVPTFVICVSSYHCASPRGIWLHLLCTLQLQTTVRSLLNLPFLRLNKPSPVLIRHVLRFPGHLDVPSVDSFPFVSALYWENQNWTRYPEAVSQVPQRGKITFLELLAIAMLIQPRKWLAFGDLIAWPFN